MEAHPPLSADARGTPPAPLLDTTDDALDAVFAALGAGHRSIVVGGPPGSGKTLLLRVLEERAIQHFRVVRCPMLPLAEDELSTWLLAHMGRCDRPGGRPGEAALFARLQPGPVLLLGDEAQALPEATARRLARWIDAAEGALRVVLAGIAGPTLTRVARALGEDVVDVALHPRLDERTAALMRDVRLRDPRLLEVERRGLAEADLAELLRSSRGVPGAFARELTVCEARAALSRPARAQGGRGTRSAPRGRVPVPVESAPEATASTARAPQRPAPSARETLAPAPARVATSPPELVASDAPEHLGRPRGAPHWAPAPARPFPRLVSTRVAAACLALPALLALGWAASRRDPARESSIGAPVAAAAAPPEPVLVNVNAVPWAHVRMDGRDLGVTPIGGVAALPGAHRVVATFADGTVAEHVVVVEQGARFVSLRPGAEPSTGR